MGISVRQNLPERDLPNRPVVAAHLQDQFKRQARLRRCLRRRILTSRNSGQCAGGPAVDPRFSITLRAKRRHLTALTAVDQVNFEIADTVRAVRPVDLEDAIELSGLGRPPVSGHSPAVPIGRDCKYASTPRSCRSR